MNSRRENSNKNFGNLNIGKKIAERLNSIGINSKEDLKMIGSVEIYKMLSRKYMYEKLPLCYYLYSIEGAILNCNWRLISKKRKDELKNQLLN